MYLNALGSVIFGSAENRLWNSQRGSGRPCLAGELRIRRGGERRESLGGSLFDEVMSTFDR